MSVWEDLESVFAFAYGGLHGEALRGRREWFVPTEWPIYCAWWVVDGHIPHYAEAVERAAHYHAHGPTPTAFDFRTAFDSDGNPMQLDRVRAAALRQADRRVALRRAAAPKSLMRGAESIASGRVSRTGRPSQPQHRPVVGVCCGGKSHRTGTDHGTPSDAIPAEADLTPRFAGVPVAPGSAPASSANTNGCRTWVALMADAHPLRTVAESRTDTTSSRSCLSQPGDRSRRTGKR